ncbi:MAG: hypothetical protein ABIR06_14050 [Cyclobacteriaceae bacterium]
MKKIFVLAIAIPLISAGLVNAQKGKAIDLEATRETRALYKSLKKISKKKTGFNHPRYALRRTGVVNPGLSLIIFKATLPPTLQATIGECDK